MTRDARTPAPARWLLTSDEGLEDLLAEEVVEHGGCVEESLVGAVVASGADLRWRDLRLCHDVAQLAIEADVASLVDVRRAVGELALPAVAEAASFRVVGAIAGGAPHAPFTRRELAGAVGAALVRRHGTPVDLSAPAVEVRAELRRRTASGDESTPHPMQRPEPLPTRLLVGLACTRVPLSKRLARAPGPRSTLRTTLAAALVRMTGVAQGARTVLDPVCGVGTLPIEAAAVAPRARIAASDWDEPTLEAARATFATHGVAVETRLADARTLGLAWEGRAFDVVLLDPPYGLRQGRRTRLDALYADLLRGAGEVLDGAGRIGIVTPRRRALDDAGRAASLETTAERVVGVGDLRLVLRVLERGR